MGEADLIEAVILLPENLFYNTTAPGIVMVINKNKTHPEEVLLINASKLFSKGRPKNHLTEEHVEQTVEIYHEWREEKGVSAIVSKAIVSKEEVARNDYNLSPSRYVAGAEEEEVLPLEEAVVLLQEAEEERDEADRELDEVLSKLGLGVRQVG
jgi:type I restriction enzyme M protein